MSTLTTNPSILRDSTNNLNIEEDKSKCRDYYRKKEIARERWKILAKALLEPKNSSCKNCSVKDISVRGFSSFELVTPSNLENIESEDGCWLKYTASISNFLYSIEIHHLLPKLTPKYLIDFNNTGNIRVWPSEEVLTYCVLSKINLFLDKEVLEVGGGMTCLAGMMLAKYGNVKKIDLTDGNVISVENVDKIIRKNQLDKRKVRSFELNWTGHKRLTDKYDVVLSSDCLFFDETRVDLVETLWNSLKDDGMALVMAPRRGATLNDFVEIALGKGFSCAVLNIYDRTVWKQHLKFKKCSKEYNENLHYPILLLLSKSSRGSTFWKLFEFSG